MSPQKEEVARVHGRKKPLESTKGGSLQKYPFLLRLQPDDSSFPTIQSTPDSSFRNIPFFSDCRQFQLLLPLRHPEIQPLLKLPSNPVNPRLLLHVHRTVNHPSHFQTSSSLSKTPSPSALAIPEISFLQKQHLLDLASRHSIGNTPDKNGRNMLNNSEHTLHDIKIN